MDKIAQVCEILQRLRPAMQADGGDVSLGSIRDGTVWVRLEGTCLSCPSSAMTLKYGIERALRTELPWVVKVLQIPNRSD